MKNAIELYDTELDMVNGGFDLGDLYEKAKKAVNKVIDYTEKKIEELADDAEKLIKKVVPVNPIIPNPYPLMGTK